MNSLPAGSLALAGMAAALLSAIPPAPVQAQTDPVLRRISSGLTSFSYARPVFGQELKVKSEGRHAGAFTSMIFRGTQYVDSADHGRLMQGAIAFNDRYECDNPTQAGGSRDIGNLFQRSSSQRLSATIRLNGFDTSTRMAYWKRPGTDCDIPGIGSTPNDNTSRISDVIYDWSHSFGYLGLQNAVKVDIAYTLAFPRNRAVVEALTIHTPTYFDTVHIWDPATDTLTLEPTLTPFEITRPFILSTADGASAIGYLSLSPGATYGSWRLPTNSKISVVYRPISNVQGRMAYSIVWAVGMREEVRTALRTANASAPRP
jgi:hypothetical protein